MLNNSPAVKADKFISSSEAAIIIKKSDDIMDCVTRTYEGRRKIDDNKINTENDVKMDSET
jgi:hypothetical protein